MCHDIHSLKQCRTSLIFHLHNFYVLTKKANRLKLEGKFKFIFYGKIS